MVKVGVMVCHYKILADLDGGGMGVVFKAMDVKLDRPVEVLIRIYVKST
jgi:hypothetical protein